MTFLNVLSLKQWCPRRNEGTRQIRVILYASVRGCADLPDHERSSALRRELEHLSSAARAKLI